MSGRGFSLVLLSTLQCNAACEYCFETKTDDRLTLDQLAVIIARVLEYLDEQGIARLALYWQGGEAMLLPPSWYEQAHEHIQRAADAHGKQVRHYLQSNMLGYDERWDAVIRTMFGNSVGTSVDYPNLHRKLIRRDTAAYDDLWARKVRQARAAGIEVTAIAVPNQGTLDIGAERFYRYFVEELGLRDFQVNPPFPGGEPNAVKQGLNLDPERLTRFYLELADIWGERGCADGVRIGPFSELLDHFSHRPACLPCIWHENCADTLVAIDPRGFVAQCDCWVASYSAYRFGNLLESASLAALLRASPARRQFAERPIALVEGECLRCDYLSLCHGGCPVRTFSVRGTLFERDPNCSLYRSLFRHIERMAVNLAGKTVQTELNSA